MIDFIQDYSHQDMIHYQQMEKTQDNVLQLVHSQHVPSFEHVVYEDHD